MKKNLLALFIFLMMPLQLTQASTSNVLIFGGGGEPKGNTTIFDNNLESFGNFFKNNNWNHSAMAFNGGHTQTEDIINRKFGQAENKGHFTANQYNQMIDDYIQKIKDGVITSGGNLLVYVDTHGGQKENGQLTHSISLSGSAITDTSTIKGGDTVSLDKLNDLRIMAKKKGIKLAIVDLSCHSGATLELADENTCVVSSTGPNHLGYAGANTFGSQFVSRFQKGKNLEEIFLEAREVADDNGTPMISTPEDNLLKNSLYESLTPYLYHANQDGDKLGSYLLQMKEENLMCHIQNRDEDLKRINKFIDDIEAANMINKRFLFWTFKEKGIDFTSMRENIKNYKAIQDKMIEEIKNVNTEELKNIEMIPFEDAPLTPLTWGELLKTDYHKLIETKELEIRNDPTNTELVRSRNWFRVLLSKKESLASSKPSLKAAVEKALHFDRMVESTYNLANKIKLDEKRLYNAAYKKFQKQTNEGSNPCRDFVL